MRSGTSMLAILNTSCLQYRFDLCQRFSIKYTGTYPEMAFNVFNVTFIFDFQCKTFNSYRDFLYRKKMQHIKCNLLLCLQTCDVQDILYHNSPDKMYNLNFLSISRANSADFQSHKTCRFTIFLRSVNSGADFAESPGHLLVNCRISALGRVTKRTLDTCFF